MINKIKKYNKIYNEINSMLVSFEKFVKFIHDVEMMDDILFKSMYDCISFEPIYTTNIIKDIEVIFAEHKLRYDTSFVTLVYTDGIKDKNDLLMIIVDAAQKFENAANIYKNINNAIKEITNETFIVKYLFKNKFYKQRKICVDNGKLVFDKLIDIKITIRKREINV